MMVRRIGAFVLIGLISLLACTADDQPVPTPSIDASTSLPDASQPDTSVRADGGIDAGTDTSAPMDAAPDASVDADTEAATDADMTDATDATDATDDVADVALPDAPDADDAADGATCTKPTNYALAFNGSQYVSIPDSPTLHLTDVTIELWASFASAPSLSCIVCKPYGTGTADSWALWYEAGALHAGANPSNPADAIGVTWAPTIDQYYHLAYTFDHITKEQKLYIDGLLVASGTTTQSILYDSHPVLIGADIDSGNLSWLLGGKVDEVRLWDSVRPIADVQMDLHSCTPGAVSGLAGYWPLDDNGTQTVSDLGAGNNPGFLGATNGVESSDPTTVTSSVVF